MGIIVPFINCMGKIRFVDISLLFTSLFIKERKFELWSSYITFLRQIMSYYLEHNVLLLLIIIIMIIIIIIHCTSLVLSGRLLIVPSLLNNDHFQMESSVIW